MALARRGLLPLLRQARASICCGVEQAAPPAWRQDREETCGTGSVPSSSVWSGFAVRGEREGKARERVWQQQQNAQIVRSIAHRPRPPLHPPGFASELAPAKALDLSPCDALSASPTSDIM